MSELQGVSRVSEYVITDCRWTDLYGNVSLLQGYASWQRNGGVYRGCASPERNSKNFEIAAPSEPTRAEATTQKKRSHKTENAGRKPPEDLLEDAARGAPPPPPSARHCRDDAQLDFW